jgi:chromosome transmission fidelity protein 8
MPTITLRRPESTSDAAAVENPLPELLQTPCGLAMVEVQGSVLSEEEDSSAASALSLGRLVFPSADNSESSDWDGKRVFLFIGKHQRMAGEVKKLSRPVAVVRRPTEPTAAQDVLEVAEIVYYKMLFQHRPEPMGAEQVLQEE